MPLRDVLAVLAALPFAQVDLAQIGFDPHRQPGTGGERRGGLRGSLQRRDVNRLDSGRREAFADPLGLRLPELRQRRIAMPVHELECPTREVSLRLTVPDQHQIQTIRRNLELALVIGSRLWRHSLHSRHKPNTVPLTAPTTASRLRRGFRGFPLPGQHRRVPGVASRASTAIESFRLTDAWIGLWIGIQVPQIFENIAGVCFLHSEGRCRLPASPGTGPGAAGYRSSTLRGVVRTRSGPGCRSGPQSSPAAEDSGELSEPVADQLRKRRQAIGEFTLHGGNVVAVGRAGKPDAVHLGQLLRQRHAREQVLDSVSDWQRGFPPRLGYRGQNAYVSLVARGHDGSPRLVGRQVAEAPGGGCPPNGQFFGASRLLANGAITSASLRPGRGRFPDDQLG